MADEWLRDSGDNDHANGGECGGDREGDRPVVFLHGLGQSSEALEGLADDVAVNTRRRVKLVDFPGISSRGMPVEEAPSRRGFIVEWLVGLLEREGISRADFVGYSFGARVALDALSRRPQLAHNVALIAPASLDLVPQDFLDEGEFQSCVRGRGKSRDQLFSDEGWLKDRNPVTREVVRDACAGFHDETFFAEVSPLLTKQARMLLVFGGRDRLAPVGSANVLIRGLKRSVPAHVFPEVGHDILKQKKAELGQLVSNFLAGL